ncbi:arginine repressor [Bacteroidales bacterium OttesenSCG-928-M11]|nr:arginine repressor [Bacteroidales bacterium OttesenSCG-928-M11]
MRKIKEQRQEVIRELIQNHSFENQEELLSLLQERGFETTQATLSRDIKELKIIKSPNNNGDYIYTLLGEKSNTSSLNSFSKGAISLEFSNKLGVIKTPPGYAAAIALDIDNLKSDAILGTIAGDDTILLIPKEGYSRESIVKTLNKLNSHKIR